MVCVHGRRARAARLPSDRVVAFFWSDPSFRNLERACAPGTRITEARKFRTRAAAPADPRARAARRTPHLRSARARLSENVGLFEAADAPCGSGVAA